MNEIKSDVVSGAVLHAGMSDVGAAVEAVKALHGGGKIDVEGGGDGLSLLTVPAGMRVVDFTEQLDARAGGPRRIKGTETAATLESFVEIVKRHKTAATAIWADASGPKLTAVIDYHFASVDLRGAEPGWCGHRVAYSFPFTKEFQRWKSATLLSQKDFLKLVQERAREIVDPEDVEMPPQGSLVRDTLLDVQRARGTRREARESAKLETLYGTAYDLIGGAKRMSSKVSSSVQEIDRGLGNITVSYVDEKQVKGSEDVREYYLVEVEVFRGSGRVVMPARLRAEASSSGLQLGMELIGVDRVVDAAFTEALAMVAEATGCPVYQGSTG